MCVSRVETVARVHILARVERVENGSTGSKGRNGNKDNNGRSAARVYAILNNQLAIATGGADPEIKDMLVILLINMLGPSPPSPP